MALFNRAYARSWLLASTAVFVTVAFGCSSEPPAGKRHDSRVSGDESESREKKKTTSADTEKELSSENGTIELGSGTRGTEDPNSGEGSASKTAPTTCTADAQCNQVGRICTSGACVKGCRSNAGCATNQICSVMGQCVSSAPSVQCYGDYDCDLGKICSTTGQCIPGCYDANDCVKGQACVSGQCKVSTTTTTTGTSSSGGTTTTTVQCTSDGACNPGNNGAGKICSATGQCVDGCHKDIQCPGSKICVNGACR